MLGGAGTGKTTLLVRRFASLVADGVAAESILVVTLSPGAADDLRVRVEERLGDRAFEELHVATVPGFCARLLRDEALEAGLDPFVAPATPADRLAMLLSNVDDLVIRSHDFSGDPAAMLAGVASRIDRLKEELVTAQRFGEWAATLPGDDVHAQREREFAALYHAHDRLLAEQGLLDMGDLVLRTQALLDERPDVLARTRARHAHVLADELQDLSLAQVRLLRTLAGDDGAITATGDDDQSLHRVRGASTRNVRDFQAAYPAATTIVLPRSHRCRARIIDAAHAVVAANSDRVDKPLDGEPGGRVAFWSAASERAQAQSVATEIGRLIRDGARPGRIAVLVRSVRSEGQAVALALGERAVPHRLGGAAAFFQRAEIRDVLAWLRLLVDPGDAGAVVRALARAPIGLRSIDLARCIQIARRRKLDMVGALVAATESPQIPPEARERILQFLKIHRAAEAALDSSRPDLYVHRLIERLGLRRQQLFAAQADVVERLRSLSRLTELAAAYSRRAPQATAREFAQYIGAVAEAGLREEEPDREAHPDAVAVLAMHAAKGLEFDHVFVCGLHSSRMPGARRVIADPIPDALLAEDLPPDTREAHLAGMRRLLHVAMTRARRTLVLTYSERAERGAPQQPSPFAEEARAALGAQWETHDEELFGPDETLHATFTALRDELIAGIPRVGARLGELRLDTDVDVAHGTARYLELVKLAALIALPEGQTVQDALPGINAAILQAATSQQREILETSPLDEMLLGADADTRARTAAVAARDEPSLEAFLPRRGDGLALSASDIDTYRTCPLKYKFARVFRIPSEPTVYQRFGIVVHQVLERYHADGGAPGEHHHVRSLDDLLGLLDVSWRRSGLGFTEEERQLRAKADSALRRYHERFVEQEAEPIWLERAFQFRLGRHTLRGRVDRVDRLPDGGYELIDYKTGRPKSVAQLREDVQLSLYAVASREAWDIDSSRQTYHYVLDDEKVPVPSGDIDRDWIAETVAEVAEGILGQGFEPTPSYPACSICDYRIVCPAAER